MPSPQTDLAASLTRIPDVGAGAFALWWLSAYAGIDGAKDCKAKLVNDFTINLYNPTSDAPAYSEFGSCR